MVELFNCLLFFPSRGLPQYQTVEAAVATRNRLHGTKWPSTNPKLLDVDFLSAEEAQKLSEGGLVLEEELVQPDGGPKEVGVAMEETKEEVKDGTAAANPKQSVEKSARTGKGLAQL